MMTIERKRNTINYSISTAAYEVMNSSRPLGCPFPNYTYFDLLKDLINMYDWKLSFNKGYTLSEFLTICNDAKADIYRDNFLRMEAIK